MANKYTSLASLFDAIANAIREKTGSNEEIIADNFPDKIETIAIQKPEQEKITTAGTSAISVIPDNGKVLSKVTINPTPSQTKTIAPNTSVQTVSPDSGKLLSSVTVSAIQTETKSVSPSTSAQDVTPTSGKYLSKVTVNAMPNGAMSDITVSSSGLITTGISTAGYLSTSATKTKQMTTKGATTITPSTSAQTAISSGTYATGNITVSAVPTETKTVTPSTSSQTVTPSSGKFLSSVTVNGDTDLIASNIRAGIDIFGVIGTMSEGVSGVDYGSISLSSKSESITINHGLASIPSRAYIFAANESSGYTVFAINGYSYWKTSQYDTTGQPYYNRGANMTATSTSVKWNCYSSIDYTAKWNTGTYYWVVFA